MAQQISQGAGQALGRLRQSLWGLSQKYLAPTPQGGMPPQPASQQWQQQGGQFPPPQEFSAAAHEAAQFQPQPLMQVQQSQGNGFPAQEAAQTMMQPPAAAPYADMPIQEPVQFQQPLPPQQWPQGNMYPVPAQGVALPMPLPNAEMPEQQTATPIPFEWWFLVHFACMLLFLLSLSPVVALACAAGFFVAANRTKKNYFVARAILSVFLAILVFAVPEISHFYQGLLNSADVFQVLKLLR